MMDAIKIALAMGAYLGLGPLWGVVISRDRRLENATIIGFIFLTGLHIDTTVIMAGSIEWYRGVTKGYEFSMIDVAAISLLVCALVAPGRRFALFPGGSLVWAFYVFACSLSILSALEVNYVLMSIWKFSKCWLLAVAVCNSIREADDFKVYLDAIVILILYQLAVVLKMKYVDGIYQVRGLFEHQNPLAMFTYMAVLPLLSCSLSKHLHPARSLLYLAGFGAGAVIILAALSRAALALFGVGSILVVGLGLALRPSMRKVTVALAGLLGAAALLSMTLDTIISRFGDEGNQASGETREVMNLAAVAMAKDKPLGIGWNNFGKAINHPYPYGDVIDDWNRDRGQAVDEDYAKGVVESIYYLHLGENGYLGLASFILVLAWQLARSGWHIFASRKSLAGDLALGIAVALLITAVHLQLERVLTQTKNLALWMVMMGLVAAMPRIQKTQRQSIGSSFESGGLG